MFGFVSFGTWILKLSKIIPMPSPNINCFIPRDVDRFPEFIETSHIKEGKKGEDENGEETACGQLISPYHVQSPLVNI